MEAGVGTSLGHAEARAFVEWLLSREEKMLEPLSG